MASVDGQGGVQPPAPAPQGDSQPAARLEVSPLRADGQQAAVAGRAVDEPQVPCGTGAAEQQAAAATGAGHQPCMPAAQQEAAAGESQQEQVTADAKAGQQQQQLQMDAVAVKGEQQQQQQQHSSDAAGTGAEQRQQHSADSAGSGEQQDKSDGADDQQMSAAEKAEQQADAAAGGAAGGSASGSGASGGKGGGKGKPKLPRPEGKPPCPRCASMETKFCYYNNYNIKQPRYFCKACQRYWTAGGTLRDLPPGAGRRKSKSASGKPEVSGCSSADLASAVAAAAAAAAPMASAHLAPPAVLPGMPLPLGGGAAVPGMAHAFMDPALAAFGMANHVRFPMQVPQLAADQAVLAALQQQQQHHQHHQHHQVFKPVPHNAAMVAGQAAAPPPPDAAPSDVEGDSKQPFKRMKTEGGGEANGLGAGSVGAAAAASVAAQVPVLVMAAQPMEQQEGLDPLQPEQQQAGAQQPPQQQAAAGSGGAGAPAAPPAMVAAQLQQLQQQAQPMQALHAAQQHAQQAQQLLAPDGIRLGSGLPLSTDWLGMAGNPQLHAAAVAAAGMGQHPYASVWDPYGAAAAAYGLAGMAAPAPPPWAAFHPMMQPQQAGVAMGSSPMHDPAGMMAAAAAANGGAAMMAPVCLPPGLGGQMVVAAHPGLQVASLQAAVMAPGMPPMAPPAPWQQLGMASAALGGWPPAPGLHAGGMPGLPAGSMGIGAAGTPWGGMPHSMPLNGWASMAPGGPHAAAAAVAAAGLMSGPQPGMHHHMTGVGPLPSMSLVGSLGGLAGPSSHGMPVLMNGCVQPPAGGPLGQPSNNNHNTTTTNNNNNNNNSSGGDA